MWRTSCLMLPSFTTQETTGPTGRTTLVQIPQVEAATSYVHKPSNTTKKDTALIPIYIKLRINDTVLIDSFEWDVSNDLNNPDAFAAALCADLGLDDGEFQVQIALSIRDQLLAYAKVRGILCYEPTFGD
ncbi:hypothetical protein DYB34_012667 [Aphanomyces astaci]|uniref:Uncharacterized protein n=1 Tax=Aphanomyces astaci TaxID=112090 RepID=A0A418BQG3_APHAT|nr:hypothetical protein DYB34_012667 [Aphanomyces astaci]